MTHNAGVCEVPDALQVTLGHLNRNGKKLIQDGHAVGDVDYLVVARNLSNEVAWVVQVG